MTQDPPSPRRGIAIFAAIALVVVVALVVGLRSSGDVPPAPSQPEVTEVYVTCEPNDSTVTRADDGTVLGRTPLTLTLPKSPGELLVVVHHDGFQDRQVHVPLFSATGRIDVALTSLDASPEAAPKSRPAN